MRRADAIIELKNEHRLISDLVGEVNNLIALMRDLPRRPEEAIVKDLIEEAYALSIRLRVLMDEEERLVFPSVRRNFPWYGKELKESDREHNDLRLSLTTLNRLMEQLYSDWDPTYIEQAWALVDHIGEVLEEHTEREFEIFDHISSMLTNTEHQDVVNGLRSKRNLGLSTL